MSDVLDTPAAESDTTDSAAVAELADTVEAAETETSEPEVIPPPAMIPVHEAFAALQRDVVMIPKTQRNNDAGFDFRGVDDVMDAIGPAQRRHGLFILQRVIKWTSERYRTTEGVGMKAVEVEVEFTIYGPMGDTIAGSAVGDAADRADRALAAAQSVAYRTFLLTGTSMPTRQTDPDMANHKRASRNAEADAARAAMTALFRKRAGKDDDLFKELHAEAMREFADAHGGIDIRDCLDPRPILALTEKYRKTFAELDAANKTAD